jgi:hypothetical protein
MSQNLVAEPPYRSIGRRAYFAVLILLLLFGAAGFWYPKIRATSHLGELDYGEGIVLYQAILLQDFRSAYKPIDQYPFIVIHYPPLYHVAVRTFTKLTGDIVSAGRWVSVLSGMLIELTIALMVFLSLPRRFEFINRVTPALFGGTLANSLDSMLWTAFARVDTLALLLSFIGIAVFVLQGRRKKLQYLAFVFFVAAVFTKQTMLAAPLACLTVALLIDFRHTVRLALFGGILGASVLTVLTWMTHGGVIRHWFFYNRNLFSVMRAWHGLNDNFATMVPIVALAGACVVSVVVQTVNIAGRGRWHNLKAKLELNRYYRLAFVCTVLLIYALVISVTYGKMGSNINYFLEWNLVCCPLAALTVFRAVTYPNSRRVSVPILATTYLLPLLIAMQAFPGSVGNLRSDYNTSVDDGSATLIQLIRQAQGPVLSENMILLIRAGKEIPAEPAIVQQLAETGMWDQGLLIKMIEDHRFPMIIVRNLDRFTPMVADAITQSYPRLRSIGRYKVYEP